MEAPPETGEMAPLGWVTATSSAASKLGMDAAGLPLDAGEGAPGSS